MKPATRLDLCRDFRKPVPPPDGGRYGPTRSPLRH
jgi:hypothetical protein